MALGDIGHEAFLRRRKIEEQQHAADLQRAIELQGCRFTGLQLLDLKNRGHHLGSPMSFGRADGDAAHLEDVAIQGPVLALLLIGVLALSEFCDM